MSLDSALVVGVLVLLVWYKLSDVLSWLQLGQRQAASGQRQAASGQRSTRSPGKNYRSARSARYNRVQQVQQVQQVQPAAPAPGAPGAGQILPATTLELTQLARAITLIATGSTEQVAIELSFHCSKGGGSTWKRAKALLDAATKDVKPA